MFSSTADEAESFACKFSSNFNLDSSREYLSDFRSETLRSDMHITLFMVPAIVSKLEANKAYRLDGVPSIVLKKCVSVSLNSTTNALLLLDFQFVRNLL